MATKEGLPRRFAGAELRHLDERTFGAVLDYYDNLKVNMDKGVGLVLSGAPGVGKSYAISALTTAAVGHHVRIKRKLTYEFATAPLFFQRLNPITPEGMDTRRNKTWVETYSTVRWLVINDLGKEYRAGGFKEQIIFMLGQVLRERSERMLVTHITTNLSLEKKRVVSTERLADAYGDSISSLLKEMALPVVVQGEDRRSVNGRV
jgi:DNA replication protein DnaC